jgi:hypothetical protein
MRKGGMPMGNVTIERETERKEGTEKRKKQR